MLCVSHYCYAGKSETLREKLCSILAQFEYQYCIQMWHNKGIDFKTYLYVPEVHPETGEMFIEREDDAHVLKVCRFAYFCSITDVPYHAIENCQPHTFWWAFTAEFAVLSRGL